MMHHYFQTLFLTKLSFCGLSLWILFNYLNATEPLRGGSLPFTTKFPEIPGTHLIDPKKMKS